MWSADVQDPAFRCHDPVVLADDQGLVGDEAPQSRPPALDARHPQGGGALQAVDGDGDVDEVGETISLNLPAGDFLRLAGSVDIQLGVGDADGTPATPIDVTSAIVTIVNCTPKLSSSP